MDLEKLGNIHHVGVYLQVEDKARAECIKEQMKIVTDGFSAYYADCEEKKRIVVYDLRTLTVPAGAIVVPENAYYFDGVFYSQEMQVAFKKTEAGMDFWTDEETTWFFPYVLQMLMEDEGKTFVHGAGVVVNGNEGYLLSAFGGIGKTCFVANALKKDNVTLLGDDLILLDREGYLYSYPRPFCLYEYHQVLFPQFFAGKKLHFETMSRNRYGLRIWRRLKKELHIKDKIIYDFLPVSPIHLFAKDKLQVAPVKLKKVLVLRRIKGLEKINCHPAEDVTKAANFTHDVIQHEWSVGIRLAYNYYAQREEAHVDSAAEQFKTILSAFSKAEEIQYIDIPESMNAETVSAELNKLILGQ